MHVITRTGSLIDFLAIIFIVFILRIGGEWRIVSKIFNRKDKRRVAMQQAVFGILTLIFIGGCNTTHAQQAAIVTLDSIDLTDALNITFSPSGDEVFWTVPYRDKRRTFVCYSRRVNGRWTEPSKAFFTTGEFQETMPRISPDGKLLIYFSNRPYEGKPGKDDLDVWSSGKTNGVWSTPRPNATLSSDSIDYFCTFSKNGSLYITSSRRGGLGKEDIWKAVADGAGYHFENIGGPVNTELLNSVPAISPGEDYVVFYTNTKIDEDYGKGDLYISFRKGKRWSIPLNLGPLVNSEDFELSPSFSNDGEIFYFVRGTPRGTGEFDKWTYTLYAIEVKYLCLDHLKKQARYVD
jgi:hypothetical protein